LEVYKPSKKLNMEKKGKSSQKMEQLFEDFSKRVTYGTSILKKL